MLHRLFAPLAVAALLVAASGCADDDSKPMKGCNTLVDDGPEVVPMLVTSGRTPEGGTIEDGVYEQTGYDYYADPGATLDSITATYTAVVELTGGTLQAALGRIYIDGEEQSQRFTASYEATDTELTLTYSCPESGVVERPQYTATPNELILFYRIADDQGTAEVVLTKR